MSIDVSVDKQNNEEKENIQTEQVLKNDALTKADANSIKNKLSEIENQYADKYPKYDESEIFKDAQYKKVLVPSSDEMKEIAAAELEGYKEINLREINNDYKADLDALKLKEQAVEYELEKEKNNLAQDLKYDLASTQAENISNGVQVSSIANNQKQAVYNKIDSELQDALNKANADLAQIALKRGIAENEFQLALDKFDIAYASKLEDKINKLNAEYTKKELEAQEYNKKISKQREQLLENWKINKEIVTSKLDAEKGQEKAFYVIEQLKDLTKKEAVELLKDGDIIKALGNWYTPVMDYVQRVLR